MRKEEIKETKEVVVGTKYIAEDGTVFYSSEECEKYEKSALFVTRSKLKVIAITTEEYVSIDGCCDYEVEIFDIQTQEDLDNLKMYLHFSISNNTYINIEDRFENSEYGFKGVTSGHEVMVWWDYEKDNFSIYGDGSINAYGEYVKNLTLKAIDKYKESHKETKEENKEV